jgi:hypothetical protein
MKPGSSFEVGNTPTATALIESGESAVGSATIYFEKLRQIKEPALNQHLITQHLAMPGALECVGLQFDAELAQHQGYVLDETALCIVSLLKAIDSRDFGRTTTYTRIIMEPANWGWLDEIGLTTPKRVLRFVNQHFSYTDYLRAELSRLKAMDIVSEDVAEKITPYTQSASINPAEIDSFFARFAIDA